MKQSRMSSPRNRTSSTNEEDQSLWLAEIKELKGKRPRALTEELTTDILVPYCSLQVQDMKRKMKHPGRKCCKGYYQRQVSSVLGYSSKMVGLTYRDWIHQHKINVAHAGANRNPKCQRIPKSKHVLLAVRAT